MLTISLLLNIVVLIPVCIGIVSNAAWVQSAYGQRSPARDILLSIYIAVALISAALLYFQNVLMASSLLAVQIIYKVGTPWTVGNLRNPVVISNLVIAAVHTATLGVIWLHP